MKLLKTAMLLFLIAVCTLNIFAQTPSDLLTKKLDSILTNFDAVGFSVVAVNKDKIVYSKGFGKRNVAKDLPVDTKTKYRIASISKSFVATAIMQLVEQKKIKLTDDIGTILGYPVRNPNYPNDPITVQMLLSHTSSMVDKAGYGSIGLIKAEASFANRKPGTYFQYCNLGFSTLGCIVEKVANKRFDRYIRENILIPLGMNASYNVDDFTSEDFTNIATLYRKSNNVWTPQTDDYNGVKPASKDLSKYVIGESAFMFSPTGGMRTSAEDLAKFMIAHFNGGVYNSARILNDSSTKLMRNPKWIFNGSNGDNMEGYWWKYGFAFHTAEKLIKGKTFQGVPGEAYGLISDMYYNPESGYGIVFMTNGWSKAVTESNGFYNIENQVFNSVVDILMKK